MLKEMNKVWLVWMVWMVWIQKAEAAEIGRKIARQLQGLKCPRFQRSKGWEYSDRAEISSSSPKQWYTSFAAYLYFKGLKML